MHDRPAEIIPPDSHRDIAKALFNRAWTLLDTSKRTPLQDDEMIATAQASYWHWLQVGTEKNRQRGHWLIARCNAEAGRGHEALRHADCCLDSCKAHDHGQFDLAFAHESRARALIALADHARAESALTAAAQEGAAIESEDDRGWLTQNLSQLQQRIHHDNRHAS